LGSLLFFIFLISDHFFHKNSSEVVDGKCRAILLYSCHRTTPAFTIIFQGMCFNYAFLVVFDYKGLLYVKQSYKGLLFKKENQ